MARRVGRLSTRGQETAEVAVLVLRHHDRVAGHRRHPLGYASRRALGRGRHALGRQCSLAGGHLLQESSPLMTDPADPHADNDVSIQELQNMVEHMHWVPARFVEAVEVPPQNST